MKYVIVGTALAFLFIGCQPNQQQEASDSIDEAPVKVDHHSASITQVFDAHGGYANWASMKQMSYDRGGEKTVVNLENRKIKLTSETQTIGFDGANVWIAPDSLDASRARFYHNLYFYFYAMPFVVGDPGVFYEDVEPKDFLGKSLNGVKVSYGDGIGDSPKDYYIVWYDPTTYKMEWLMYTVTFRSGEAHENYNLIKYDQWAEVEGLNLPTTIQWYVYKDGEIGEMRNEATFENIQLSVTAPSDDLFVMPEGAKIAPPPPPTN